jgi:Mrp family chromosome partitioning ATPase/capsular polysaccharide biosynthesis protein
MTAGHAATLRDYLHVVQRRKWVILIAAVLVPVSAVALSIRQKPVYQASASVFLANQDFASALAGVPAPNSIGAGVSGTGTQTQAVLARVPAVAWRVVTALHLPISTAGFLAQSSVSSAANADILTFTVTDGNPALAARMAAEYATQYTLYRRRLDTAALESARQGVQRRIDELQAQNAGSGQLYASLVEKEQQLQTFETLQTSNANVVQTPTGAAKISPRPKRNGILGIALGLVLGFGLAFLLEALDTRVRSVQEIGERLGLPLLARVPEPRRRIRAKHRLVMLEEPSGAQAETFRMLRTNLDFATLGQNARAIMVTSADQQEGKSTTIANLGVALARAGRRVVLVDLDLRRPFLAKFFDLDGPGVTQVALGHADLETALTTIAITDPSPGQSHKKSQVHGNGNGNGNGNGAAKHVRGMLEVLPSGPIPLDPGEFVGTQALTEILEQLRERADVVLIDAPPMLHVGDAITLSTKVDGIIIVTKMKAVRRQMLGELARQLSAVPVRVLGYIATGAAKGEGYGYEYDYAYGYRRGHYSSRPSEHSEQSHVRGET